LERDGEPVRRRTSEVGGCDELCQRRRSGFQSTEDAVGLVQHADSARLVHRTIVPSRRMRRKSTRGQTPADCTDGKVDEKRMGKTLAEKVWAEQVVRRGDDGAPDLLYIDLHLVHEVTSPQAFEGLRLAGRTVRRPDLTIATEDHNTPTLDIDLPIADVTS